MKKYIKPTKDTIFPNPSYVYVDLNWRLRNAPESITDNDLKYLASVCSAYYAFFEQKTKVRNELIKEIWRLSVKGGYDDE